MTGGEQGMPAIGKKPKPDRRERAERRRKRRLRMRRHGRRAYIRSVYFLPSMATLGNAICGFGAIYVAATGANANSVIGTFPTAVYLIFLAGVFDLLDGRLARMTRHTTDFGGQLDSLADVISFGAAPAFVAMFLFRQEHPDPPAAIGRLVWAIGALYMSCAAIRLARFNVSNEHGEQHHFSFLGLPSPGAGMTVAAWILMQQKMYRDAQGLSAGHEWMRSAATLQYLSSACVLLLPGLVLVAGLLMVSHVRYPHLVNRYLRGRRSMGRLIAVLTGVLLLIVAHEYAVAIGVTTYVILGLTSAVWRTRRPTSARQP
jgi:CDP-diacylglycerol--serine O-phosphatidyltransferase